jgi:hypothetical protein
MLLWNNLPNTTISLVDSEGNGNNAIDLPYGYGANLGSMPVPWYYSANPTFSQHNIQITFGGTNNTVPSGITTIYIWQNGGSVYWSNSVPTGYTDGTVLCENNATVTLTIGEGFSLECSYYSAASGPASVTNVASIINETLSSIDLTNSQGIGTNVSNLLPGASASTGSMTVPWYTGGTAADIQITGGGPTIYIWQNGAFIYWDTAAPTPSTCSTAYVLGWTGFTYYLTLDSNSMPSLQIASGGVTYLVTLVNAYSATISLTDAEGKGTNISNLACGDVGATNNMPVPWYYSPWNTNFANHNIQITNASSSQTIWIWQNGDLVYWSYTQPPAGNYTDGSILCDTGVGATGVAFSLVISDGFYPIANPVDEAAATTWAQNFLQANTQFIQQFASAIVSFATEGITHPVLKDIKLFLGKLEPPSLEHLYKKLSKTDSSQYFNSVASLLPSGSTDLFPLPFTMMAGVSGSATFFAGGEAFAGAAFTLPVPPDTASYGAGVLSAGVVVGNSVGLGVGFTVAISAGDINSQTGPSITVTFGVEEIAGVAIGISLGVPSDPNATGFVITGISITVDAGEGENVGAVSYDYTQLSSIFEWTAPAGQVATGAS